MRLILTYLLCGFFTCSLLAQDSLKVDRHPIIKNNKVSLCGDISAGFVNIYASGLLSGGGPFTILAVGAAKNFYFNHDTYWLRIAAGANVLLADLTETQILSAVGPTNTSSVTPVAPTGYTKMTYGGLFAGASFIYKHFYLEDRASYNVLIAANPTENFTGYDYNTFLVLNTVGIGLCSTYYSRDKLHHTANKLLHKYKVGLFIATSLSNVLASNMYNYTCNITSYGIQVSSY